MSLEKPKLSFTQIINMNLGFFGIQYSFGLQQSAVNPIYDFLGASPEEIPLLNLAGPLTGLIIQPVIGALSDKTWHPRWGRRKPYFFIGAVLCSIALFFYPFSSALWMAVGLLWILDIGNNTAMEPYRAFVADKLNPEQRGLGFQAQSFFTGLGQTLANYSILFFPLVFVGKTGKLPNWVFASFFLGAFCSIATVWWSMKTTPEIPPTEEELKEIKKYNTEKPHPFIQVISVLAAIISGPLLLWVLMRQFIQGQSLNLLILPLSATWVIFLYLIIKHFSHIRFIGFLKAILAPFLEIAETIRTMPRVMWMLALVYLFQWYALFCYWQNSSKAVARNVYGWEFRALTPEEEKKIKAFSNYKKQVRLYAEQNQMNEVKPDAIRPQQLIANWKEIIPLQGFSAEDLPLITAVEENHHRYEKAVSDTGGINGWYNIVTFLVAFMLVGLAKKISPRYVHMICLILAGLGFIIFSQVKQIPFFYVAITGFGIGWASMMGIPYLMVVGDIPKEKYGVFMGIINMMIVIPMFIQTTTFGYVLKNFLNNDSSKAILFAGILLWVAALLTLLVKSKQNVGEKTFIPSSGH
ncbi:MAG: MFS transporter [Chitinophagaceae bacterium]|nr:MFS transporter [Chitinophagaceae bacterium]